MKLDFRCLGLALLILPAGGCQTSDSRDLDRDWDRITVDGCNTHERVMPLGRRFVDFGKGIARIDDWAAEDLETRADYLGKDWDSFRAKKADEFEITGKTIAATPRALANEFSHRGDQLSRSTGKWYSKLCRDTRCLFARVWRDLRMIE